MGMASEPQFHVLAVDDSLFDRMLIQRLLKKSSYQVTTVDSGYKALEFLGLVEEDEQPSVSPDCQNEEVEVNLIITDYCMPGMNGYDLLKKVKESSAFRHIPVVIMSSENVPARITRCLEEGAEEFFLKPVRLSDANKLKPYMMRTKYGEHTQDLLQQFQKLDPKPEESQQKLQETEEQKQESSNNKRKSMDEGLSTDRPRPRSYNDLTVTTVV